MVDCRRVRPTLALDFSTITICGPGLWPPNRIGRRRPGALQPRKKPATHLRKETRERDLEEEIKKDEGVVTPVKAYGGTN